MNAHSLNPLIDTVLHELSVEHGVHISYTSSTLTEIGTAEYPLVEVHSLRNRGTAKKDLQIKVWGGTLSGSARIVVLDKLLLQPNARSLSVPMGGGKHFLLGVRTGTKVIILTNLVTLVRDLKWKGRGSRQDALKRFLKMLLGDAIAETAKYVKLHSYKDSRTALAELFQTKGIAARKEQLTREKATLETDIQYYLKELSRHTKQRQGKVDALRKLEEADERANSFLDGERGLELLKSLYGTGIHKFSLLQPAKGFRFLTAPVFVENVPLGRFYVSVRTDGHITIAPENTKYMRQGHCHPHIAGSGNNVSICWGSASTAVAQLTGKGRHLETIPIILQYLNTYHHDHAMLPIESWTTEVRTTPGIRWQECYDSIKTHYQCIGCYAPECGHKGYAEERCQKEHVAKGREGHIRCILCTECAHSAEAVRLCQNLGQTDECKTCPVPGATCRNRPKENLTEPPTPPRKEAM